MVLRGVIVLVRLRGRRRLLGEGLRLVLAGNWSVRTGRNSTMSVVGDVVQLWTLGIHVRLLISMLLIFRLLRLTILLPVLLRRR